jgi:16S rRNA (cytosine1402-N4)-methyltransferase
MDETPRPPRRKRYSGRNPRRWEDKYKEHRGDAETLAKVEASGKTAAGTHRPIMVDEILTVLRPKSGEIALDCTLGWGGHSERILQKISPNGKLIGLDADPLQLPQTVERLQSLGFMPPTFQAIRSNFAGAQKVLSQLQLSGVDLLLADLGVSSMQIDNPQRGFSFKHPGPLDMRMNPERGKSARGWLQDISSAKLQIALEENSDEPHAAELAPILAGKDFPTTQALAREIGKWVPAAAAEESIRRVFQALRIAVNEEFTALDTLLRILPTLMNPGGRIAILTFHSGEDRRVKKAFQAGLQNGVYDKIADEVIRASLQEVFQNSRASSAKLRWARLSKKGK